MNELILISYHFPPAGGNSAPASIRLGKFAQYLPEFGWTPLVVSASRGNFDFLDDSLMFDHNTAVNRVRNYLGRFRGLDRIMSWLPAPGFLLPWTINAGLTASHLAKRKKVKLILASSPPSASFLAGYFAHKLTGLPLVLDYRDQWTLSPYRTGPRFYRIWDRWLEAQVLKYSRLVVASNTGRLAEHNEYWKISSPKAIVIPNGFDLKDFEGVRPDRSAGYDLRSEIVIRHMGAIYGARAATTRSLLNALNDYLTVRSDAPTIRVQFTGSVPNVLLMPHSAYSSKLILERQRRASYKEALALELGADVLLLLIGRHAQSNAETSSKVFEYIASGRPILVAGESQLLRKLTTGLDRVFFIGENPSQEAIADFFHWLNNHGKGDNCAQACSWYDKYLGCYNRRNIAHNLASHLDVL
ncbi:MAG: glycosyltransferase [Candidatus Aminicenantes bacterium]|nr:glycosyltransferase [Candidatus Aminicenantes bacterium]